MGKESHDARQYWCRIQFKFKIKPKPIHEMTTNQIKKKGKQTTAKASNGKDPFVKTQKRQQSENAQDGEINPKDYEGKGLDYLENEEKMMVEAVQELTLATALSDEDSYINTLFGSRSQKAPLRNTFLAINVWGLDARRDIKYVVEDESVEVGGTFTVNKTTLYIRHTFPVLRTSHKKVGVSNCGTLFLVRSSHEEGTICGPISTGPDSFIWNKVMSVANSLSFVNSKKGLDMAYLEQQLRLSMMKLFPVCPELEETIHDVVCSDEFVLLRTKALMTMKSLKDKVKLNHKLEHELENEPLDFHPKNFPRHHWLGLMFCVLSSLQLGTILSCILTLSFVAYVWFTWEQYPEMVAKPAFRLASLLKINQICKDVDVPLQPGATLTHVRHRECIPQHVDVYGAVIPKAQLVIPKTCQCNLVSALRIRFLFERQYDEPTISRFEKFFKQWVRDNIGRINGTVPTIDEWGAGRYSKSRIAELKQARLRPLTTAHFASKAFVKMETYVGKSAADFKPRMIQARHDEFLSRVGPFFYMVSKQLTKIFDRRSKFYYTNGATSEDIGNFARSLYNKGNVYEMDVSNWDGSMGPYVLKLEQWLVNFIIDLDSFSEYGDRDDLELVKKNWCKVFGGNTNKFGSVKFKCGWGRRSGDAWTSSFNTLFNFVFTDFVAHEMGTEVVGMMALGDDNVVALGREVPVPTVQERYAKLGLKLTCAKPPLQELEYCSGRFWNLGSHVKWGVKPGKVLSKFGFNYNKHNPRVHKQLLFGTCKSLLPIAGHVPVLGSLCRAVIDTASDQNMKAKIDARGANPYKTKSISIDYPNMDTYVQFCRIYGLDLGEVMELEDRIECTMGVDTFPCELIDGIFARLAEVDGKLGHVDAYEVEHHQPEQTNFDPTDLSPLLEEIYRSGCINVFGWMGLLLAMMVPYLEIRIIYRTFGYVSYYNLLAHGFLNVFSWFFGFVPTVLVHYLLNYFMEGDLNLYEITMTNNKNKNRKQTQPKSSRAGISGQLDKFVVANIAPFADHAVGAKVPDSQMLPSVPITIRQSSVIIADANGFGAAVYKPMYRAYKFDPFAMSAGGVITWHNANVVLNAQTAIVPPGECRLIRFVGGGLRLTYESKMDDVSGSVHLAAGPDLLADPTDAVEFGALFWPIDKNEMQRSSVHHDVQVSELVRQGGIEVPFLRLDDSQDLYRRLGRVAAPVVSNDLGYDQIHTTGSSYWCVYLEGLTAGTIVEVEYIAHYECIIAPSHPTFLSQTPAKPSKSLLLDVVQQAHQTQNKPKPVKKADHTHVTDTIKSLGIGALTVGKNFLITQGANFAKNVALPFLEDAGLALLAGLL
jgi:hypothetical protein